MVLTVEEQRRCYDLSLGLATGSVADDVASQHHEFDEQPDEFTHVEHPSYYPDEPRYTEPYATDDAQDWGHDRSYQRPPDLVRDFEYEDKFPAWDEASQVNSIQQSRAPTTVHLKSDGIPDRRFRENRNSATAPGPLRKDGMPDMRYRANQTMSLAPPPGPLKRDGTPDMRYQVNRNAVASAGRQSSTPARAAPATSSAPSTIRLKKDGTPDMRFSANRRK